MSNPAAQIQAFFVLLLAAAAWLARLPRPRQWMVTKLAFIVLVALAIVHLISHRLTPAAEAALRDWLPVPLLLVPYWQTGCFFTKPDPRTESRLAAFDRDLFRLVRIQPAQVSISPFLGVYLELAYIIVYPLIPLGLAALYLTGLQDLTNYYWIVVLLATYACLAITPFVQAMPPRALTDYEKFRIPTSKVGMVNHFVLRRASIQAITFPSAHVASALAASLVLLRLEPSVGLIFLGIALSIMLATVVGGYHYAADVVLAGVVALVVFAATFPMLKPG